MSGIVLPNLGLHGDIPDHALWGLEGRANDRRLDSLVQAGVKDILNDPPSSPLDGDRYIVGSAPSGAWSGNAKSITTWNAALARWVFFTPKTGWQAYLEDERNIQRYSGGWFNDDFVLNVKRFGAVGDGAIDDTGAVVAALAALPAGGRLHFPTGTYLLSTWTVQTLSKAIWLSGAGAGNTVLKGTGAVNFLSVIQNFRCSDMTFDTWSTVLGFSAVASVLDKVLIENIEIKNYNRGVYGENLVAGTGVRGFVVQSCRFTTGTSYAIFISLPIMEQVHILGNVIKTCVQRAIDLGNNSLVFADDRGMYVVDGNLIDGVTGVGVSAIAIICFGWRAIITNNVVRNVSRDVPTASDCNGIYTKCRYSVVANNVLVDAGQAEGFINIKGGARDELVSQPHGFSVVVANNMLVDTQVNPTLAGGGKQTNGIKVATSEVLVVGNQLDGLTEIGIYTDSDSTASHPNHNIVIADNFVKNHRGKAAIAVYGRGDRIRVIDNLVDTVSNSFDPTPQNFGLDINKKEGNGIDIVGNRVFNIVDVGTTPVGIQISPGALSKVISAVDVGTDTLTTSTIHTFSVNDPVKFTSTGTLPTDGGTGLPLVVGTVYYIKTIPITIPAGIAFTLSATPGGATINLTDAGTGTHTVIKQTTLRSWRIADNHVENARYGIQFSWDQVNVAVDDVFVRHNTGRNINGITPPVLADLVKYTDVPTNLIDLPARAETVARISATVAEMKNGLLSQNVLIYGTDDGAGNYERLSVRMDSTHATISVEKGGTGALEDLEFRFHDGITDRAAWRMTGYTGAAGGHLQPMEDDTFNVGSATLHIAKLYAAFTNSATVGTVTINKMAGRCNVPLGATTVLVNNNRCRASSKVMAVAAQVDANGTRVVSVVPGIASFTITVAPAPAANMAIDFIVFSADDV